MNEIDQSLRIIEQVLDRLADRSGIVNDPWMIQDAKVGWPARLSLGPDGLGPSPEHIFIMGQSMEAPSSLQAGDRGLPGARQGGVYVPIKVGQGELGCHVVSDSSARKSRSTCATPRSIICKPSPCCAKAATSRT